VGIEYTGVLNEGGLRSGVYEREELDIMNALAALRLDTIDGRIPGVLTLTDLDQLLDWRCYR
jgi:hypothetical protein